MITIRLPWMNPALASLEEVEGRQILDLNREFRAHLLSPEFRQQLGAELQNELRLLERRRQLAGDQAWRLYRAIRLSALLESALDDETLNAYLHLLATGNDWYFTAASAWPHNAASDNLGELGRTFRDFVRHRGLPEGEIVIEDDAQIPFALLLNHPVTRRITPPPQSLDQAARYFKKNRGRLLRVTWSPAETIDRKMRAYVKKLHAHGIPVALEFAPRTSVVEPDAFVFNAMDEVLRMEPYLSQLTVRAENTSLSDVVTVQLQAELNDQRRLAPHRVRRVPVSPKTRLQAAVPIAVESRFDLAALSVQCDPGRDAHPYRLGRGRPTEGLLASRQPHAAKYLVFAECARIVPLSDDDSAYAEAVEFFATARPAGEFIKQYAPPQHTRVFEFLENLMNLGVLHTR